MTAIEQEIRQRLLDLREPDNAAFQAKLIPTVPPERFLGVRTPALRALAKELARREEIGGYLAAAPHGYFDEDCLHGLIAAEFRPYDRALEAVEAFLPFVDNWAACDMLRPKAFARCPDRLREDIRRWMASPRPYTVRFGIEMLMTHFLDERFLPSDPDEVAAVQSEEYYVNMMIAWYFATALAKQYEWALPVLREERLPLRTHNQAIQKALESRRVSEERKEQLRALRRREGGTLCRI